MVDAENSDLAWQKWCNDVRRFLAWCDQDHTEEEHRLPVATEQAEPSDKPNDAAE